MVYKKVGTPAKKGAEILVKTTILDSVADPDPAKSVRADK